MSDNKLITMRESSRFPGLFVKKYARKVFYKGLWGTDPALLEARGHVVDSNGATIIRPFTKVFNMGEQNTNISDNEMVVAVQKINGFMAAATYVPNMGVIVSTTGSLDSDFVSYAERYITPDIKETIQRHYLDTKEPVTFLFEIVHPDDPHIIQEEYGAYLIGCRNVNDDAQYFTSIQKETALDVLARQINVRRPEWHIVPFIIVKAYAKECKHEGYVVYGQTSQTVLKIKSPYYLAVKACARKKDIETLDKSKIDEEFYGLVDFIKENIDQYNELPEQARIDIIRNYLME